MFRQLGQQLMRSFQKQFKNNPLGALLAVAILAFLTWIVWRTYELGNLGFDKSLWDWMELLIVPAVLAIGVFLFNRAERESEKRIEEKRRENEERIASEHRQNEVLQSYLNHMTELLLEHKLRKPDQDAEVRHIARARTLTALRALDGKRRGILLRFLYDSDLVTRGRAVIDLRDADFSGAIVHNTFTHKARAGTKELVVVDRSDLRNADLCDVNFAGADFENAKMDGIALCDANLLEANLKHATLLNARLYGALLIAADFQDADLSNADLTEVLLHSANLTRTKFIEADLRGAKLNEAASENGFLNHAILTGANFSGAKYDLHTEWPKDFDPVRAGAVLQNTEEAPPEVDNQT